MGVSDAGDPRFPYLAPELELLERVISRDRPVLGSAWDRSSWRARLARASTRRRAARSAGRRCTSSPSSASGRCAACAPRDDAPLAWRQFDPPAGAVHLAATPTCPTPGLPHPQPRFRSTVPLRAARRHHRRLGRDDADYVRRQRSGWRRADPRRHAALHARGGAGRRPLLGHLRNIDRGQLTLIFGVVCAAFRVGENRYGTLMSANQISRSVSSRCAARTTRTTTCERASRDPRGRGARRAGHLPARALPLPVLLPGRGRRATSISPSRSRADHRGARRRSRARTGSWSSARSSSGARPGVYHNTAVVIDADGSLGGHLPQDAHPRRSALLREVLLHARRPRLPRVRHRARPHRHARLLGPVVSRRARASRRCAGADVLFYPDRDRLAPVARRPSTARRSVDAWQTIQRAHAIANGVYVAAVNRVGPRERAGGGRHRVLGRVVRGRSVRAW